MLFSDVDDGASSSYVLVCLEGQGAVIWARNYILKFISPVVGKVYIETIKE